MLQLYAESESCCMSVHGTACVLGCRRCAMQPPHSLSAARLANGALCCSLYICTRQTLASELLRCVLGLRLLVMCMDFAAVF